MKLTYYLLLICYQVIWVNDNLEMWSMSKCGPQKHTINITRPLVRSADLWVPHKFTESYSLGCASEVNIITRSLGELWQILACLL